MVDLLELNTFWCFSDGFLLLLAAQIQLYTLNITIKQIQFKIKVFLNFT